MEGLDAVAGEFQRIQRRGVAGLHGGIDLRGGDPQGPRIEIEPVELPVRLDQRGIAAGGDVGDDGTSGSLDIRRHLALGGEEVLETLVEIGAAAVQSNRHFWGFPGQDLVQQTPCSMARQTTAVNPWRPLAGLKNPVVLAKARPHNHRPWFGEGRRPADQNR